MVGFIVSLLSAVLFVQDPTVFPFKEEKSEVVYPYRIDCGRNVDEMIVEDINNRINRNIAAKYIEYGCYIVNKLTLKSEGLLASTILRSLEDQILFEHKELQIKSRTLFSEMSALLEEDKKRNQKLHREEVAEAGGQRNDYVDQRYCKNSYNYSQHVPNSKYITIDNCEIFLVEDDTRNDFRLPFVGSDSRKIEYSYDDLYIVVESDGDCFIVVNLDRFGYDILGSYSCFDLRGYRGELKRNFYYYDLDKLDGIYNKDDIKELEDVSDLSSDMDKLWILYKLDEISESFLERKVKSLVSRKSHNATEEYYSEQIDDQIFLDITILID